MLTLPPEQFPLIWLIVYGALVGLSGGSFINVLIARLPVMLERNWANEIKDYQQDPAAKHAAPEAPFNLMVPASHCPQCGSGIAWHDNIPVLSFVKRRGRCANCKGSISMRYPVIEALGGLAGGLVAFKWGLGLDAALVLTVLLTLLALAMIDFDTQLLPDVMTLPLMWAGMLFHVVYNPWQLDMSVLGAAVGYVVFWSVYQAYKAITGKEGMGYGDFKLVAALGAWLGVGMIPQLMWMTAIFSLGVLLIWRVIVKRSDPMPLGPALSLAGALLLIFG